MQILTVDVGTGTQDIFLYDSRLDLENGFKLVVPSPTMMVHRRIKEATRRRQPLLLTGVIMGGGPSQWAAEDHARAGLPVYATPDAARSFNDDLDAVRQMGIQVVSEDEAFRLPESITRLELRDFDFPAIARALGEFGVTLDDLAAVAVAVFDHGDSPPDYSDRQFRFDYLDERIRLENRLSAFAYLSDQVPPIMTRLQAVVELGGRRRRAPGGDGHRPCSRSGRYLRPAPGCQRAQADRQCGQFPYPGIPPGTRRHRGRLRASHRADRPAQARSLLRLLADGSLQHADVFGDHGHGALIYTPEPLPLGQR